MSAKRQALPQRFLPNQSKPKCPGTDDKRKRRDLPADQTARERQAKADALANFIERERNHFSKEERRRGHGRFRPAVWLDWKDIGKNILVAGWLPLYGFYMIILPNGTVKRGIAVSPGKGNFIRDSRDSLLMARFEPHLSGFTIEELQNVKIWVCPTYTPEQCSRARAVEEAMLLKVLTDNRAALEQTMTLECGLLSQECAEEIGRLVVAFINGDEPNLTATFGGKDMILSQYT